MVYAINYYYAEEEEFLFFITTTPTMMATMTRTAGTPMKRPQAGAV